MLIHSCFEVIEVSLSIDSVGLDALLCGCVRVKDLRVVGVGEVRDNTLGGEALLGSGGI
jgi:hypothetical protein